MAENLVMRSIYLPETVDAELRQLAHEHNVSKSDLVRAAVRLKLKEWREDNTKAKLSKDVAAGLREPDHHSAVKKGRPPSVASTASQARPSSRTGASTPRTKSSSKKVTTKA